MIISELSYKNIFAGNCPKSHPFAYNNGNHCCQVNHEKYYEPLGIACDGSTIDGNSQCCEDNRYTACTDRPCGDYEEGKFNEIWNETVADKLLGCPVGALLYLICYYAGRRKRFLGASVKKYFVNKGPTKNWEKNNFGPEAKNVRKKLPKFENFRISVMFLGYF